MGESAIVKWSKILAAYLGWKYYGFNCPESIANPKMRLGWYKIRDRKLNPLLYNNPKSGYTIIDENTLGAYVTRNHAGLRFFNSFDSLFEVVEKLEKEDLKNYMYTWPSPQDNGQLEYNFQGVRVDRFNGVWDVSVELQLDPAIDISNHEKYKDLPEKEQLFFNLVEAVKWVNNLKSAKNGKMVS